MRSVRDACGAVHHAAEEVVVASLGPARMQSGAHAHHDTRRGSGIGESGLDRQRGVQRVDGVVERRVNAVAAHLHDDPVVAFHRLPRDRVVASQCQTHPLGVPLPELAAAFDVREQKGGDGRHDFHAGTPIDALCDGFEVYRREARGTSAGPLRKAGHCNSPGRPLSSADRVAPNDTRPRLDDDQESSQARKHCRAGVGMGGRRDARDRAADPHGDDLRPRSGQPVPFRPHLCARPEPDVRPGRSRPDGARGRARVTAVRIGHGCRHRGVPGAGTGRPRAGAEGNVLVAAQLADDVRDALGPRRSNSST